MNVRLTLFLFLFISSVSQVCSIDPDELDEFFEEIIRCAALKHSSSILHDAGNGVDRAFYNNMGFSIGAGLVFDVMTIGAASVVSKALSTVAMKQSLKTAIAVGTDLSFAGGLVAIDFLVSVSKEPTQKDIVNWAKRYGGLDGAEKKMREAVLASIRGYVMGASSKYSTAKGLRTIAGSYYREATEITKVLKEIREEM